VQECQHLHELVQDPTLFPTVFRDGWLLTPSEVILSKTGTRSNYQKARGVTNTNPRQWSILYSPINDCTPVAWVAWLQQTWRRRRRRRRFHQRRIVNAPPIRVTKPKDPPHSSCSTRPCYSLHTGASVLPPDTKCDGRAPGCSSLVDVNDRCSQQETRLWVGNCSTTQTN